MGREGFEPPSLSDLVYSQASHRCSIDPQSSGIRPGRFGGELRNRTVVPQGELFYRQSRLPTTDNLPTGARPFRDIEVTRRPAFPDLESPLRSRSPDAAAGHHTAQRLPRAWQPGDRERCPPACFAARRAYLLFGRGRAVSR